MKTQKESAEKEKKNALGDNQKLQDEITKLQK